MEAVIKIHGKHSVDGVDLTLSDNFHTAISCSAEATYSEYSDETIIVISPSGSNSIGGIDKAWTIQGTMNVDDGEMNVYISPHVEPAIVCDFSFPADTGNLQNKQFTLLGLGAKLSSVRFESNFGILHISDMRLEIATLRLNKIELVVGTTYRFVDNVANGPHLDYAFMV